MRASLPHISVARPRMIRIYGDVLDGIWAVRALKILGWVALLQPYEKGCTIFFDARLSCPGRPAVPLRFLSSTWLYWLSAMYCKSDANLQLTIERRRIESHTEFLKNPQAQQLRATPSYLAAKDRCQTSQP